ncbi:hypothetical protein FRC12_002254 [Ceratobasidium sp. 428]|nr:hypothetical protein FRC12_002254 [Ceratobasidium sp. 428]
MMANRSQSVELSASLRALAVPELLMLVCSLLDRKDSAACLRMSRRTFAAVASVVWEDVDLKPVLLLIPGMQVTTDNTWKSEVQLKFEFPPTVDLARFEVYRSFVKAVSTAIPYAITFPKEWPDVPQPLLPNLRSIVINTFGWVDDPYVDWVPRLLSPGLKEFKMCSIPLKKSAGCDVGDHENAWINPSKCMELVDAISQVCPIIETLEIFANEEDEEDDRTEYTAICEKIAGLHSLRSLSFGGAEADQLLFHAFGQHPCLESLTLASDNSQTLPDSGSPVTLSDESFPALQHLTLRGLNPRIITRVYNSAQLFRHIISARISYEDLSYDGCESNNLRSAYTMQCFSHGCSRLTDLTILTTGNGGFFRFFRHFIPIFKRLPLRRLELCCVDLNPKLDSYEDGLEEAGLEENDPEVTWREFLTALPYIEELDLNNSLDIQDLVVFGELLPKLRYFAPREFRLDDSKNTSEVDTSSIATQPIVISAYEYPQLRYSDEDIPDIASIWPNAKFRAFRNEEQERRTESQLNEAIQALRQKEQ